MYFYTCNLEYEIRLFDMNQCGTNRFVPRKNPKIEKELFNLFLRNFAIFSKKRGSHRFSAGASGSARDKQFSAGNRFMPRFLRFIH